MNAYDHLLLRKEYCEGYMSCVDAMYKHDPVNHKKYFERFWHQEGNEPGQMKLDTY
ncbi:MAG: hypothetical protein V1859_10800 [archaeon]